MYSQSCGYTMFSASTQVVNLCLLSIRFSCANGCRHFKNVQTFWLFLHILVFLFTSVLVSIDLGE